MWRKNRVMGSEGPGALAMELKGQQRLKCAWE
jgi:hypothetical protein